MCIQSDDIYSCNKSLLAKDALDFKCRNWYKKDMKLSFYKLIHHQNLSPPSPGRTSSTLYLVVAHHSNNRAKLRKPIDVYHCFAVIMIFNDPKLVFTISTLVMKAVTGTAFMVDGGCCHCHSVPTVVTGNRRLFSHAFFAAKGEQVNEVAREEPNENLRQSIQKVVAVLNCTDYKRTSTASISDKKCSSVVHIIGTGLTPSLLSLPLSTLSILCQADVVLYDSLGLSYDDICQIVPNHCEVVCVGKRGDSSKSWKQHDIDELILYKATQQQCDEKPRTIVRLKGGDPFLFGRARSEIETLRENDVAYTYTPAISSCIAGPHLGGIPLTDTALNCQSFGVWSGTDAFGKSRGLTADNVETDFAPNVDVLVFLMIGRLDKLEGLCQLLCASGNDNCKWNARTPCAVIQNAGGVTEKSTSPSQHPIQRVWRSTLGNIVEKIRNEDESRTSVSPAVFVVGRVCELDLSSNSPLG